MQSICILFGDAPSLPTIFTKGGAPRLGKGECSRRRDRRAAPRRAPRRESVSMQMGVRAGRWGGRRSIGAARAAAGGARAWASMRSLAPAASPARPPPAAPQSTAASSRRSRRAADAGWCSCHGHPSIFFEVVWWFLTCLSSFPFFFLSQQAAVYFRLKIYM